MPRSDGILVPVLPMLFPEKGSAAYIDRITPVPRNNAKKAHWSASDCKNVKRPKWNTILMDTLSFAHTRKAKRCKVCWEQLQNPKQ